MTTPNPSSADAAATVRDCLAYVALRRGLKVPSDAFGPLAAERCDDLVLLEWVAQLGMEGSLAELGWGELCGRDDDFPIVARLNNGNAVVVVAARTGADNASEVAVLDPLAKEAGLIWLSRTRFCSNWSGRVLFVRLGRGGEDRRGFGLAWFIARLLEERRSLSEVGLASVMLQLLALGTPLFFQLVVDKVLVHESLPTLWVLTVAMAAAILFDVTFNYLRRVLLLHATNRVDVKVASHTFAHLMRLPVAFFEALPAGVLVKHMQQAERVRQFLTGRVFLTLLDGIGLLVFIPLLFFYSAWLTGLVLAMVVVTAILILLAARPFRRELSALYEAEGGRQALLVETIHGIQTVKALGIERQQCRRWNDKAIQATETSFRVGSLSAALQAASALLERLLNTGVIVLGANLVLGGKLSLGELIAFQMLAGRVVQPLLQAVTLVNEYQEVALTVRMLGRVMEAEPERPESTGGLRSPLRGRIDFEQVGFRYGQTGAPILDGVSFSVPEGTFLGIVGRSGSGKTTIARLLQGLYSAQSGIVRLDGIDCREIDLAHLRSQIGVVLQDNFLFRGTVRENIAVARPDADFAEIVEAARQAGAIEFIERLSRGFDTELEENAANLSGGQRQRLAIARALVRRPRILIFDEATSALDTESEAVIQRNLRTIATGRTLVAISHRLSMLVDADDILVIDQGRLLARGAHDDLLGKCELYHGLWRQQTRGRA